MAKDIGTEGLYLYPVLPHAVCDATPGCVRHRTALTVGQPYALDAQDALVCVPSAGDACESGRIVFGVGGADNKEMRRFEVADTFRGRDAIRSERDRLERLSVW